MKNTTIAIDLAKSVFEIGISDRPGHVARNHRLSRAEVSAFLAAQPPATVVIGSLQLVPLLGAEVSGFRARCEVASAFRCAALCATFKNRPHRRERDARSLAQQ